MQKSLCIKEERFSLKNCIERLCLKVESSFLIKMQNSLCIREERSSLKYFEHNTYSYFKSLFLCYRYLREERSSLKNRQILTYNNTVLFYGHLREERSSLKNCKERLCLKVESSFLIKMQKS